MLPSDQRFTAVDNETFQDPQQALSFDSEPVEAPIKDTAPEETKDDPEKRRLRREQREQREKQVQKSLDFAREKHLKRNSDSKVTPSLIKRSFQSTTTNDRRGVCPFCVKQMEETDRKPPQDLTYQLTVNQIIKLFDHYLE